MVLAESKAYQRSRKLEQRDASISLTNAEDRDQNNQISDGGADITTLYNYIF